MVNTLQLETIEAWNNEQVTTTSRLILAASNVLDTIFQCIVQDLDENTLWAVLRDMSEVHEDHVIEIKKSVLLSQGLDVTKMSEGTIFYWYMGHTSQKEDFQHFELSRAVWTQAQIDKIKEEGKKMHQFLNSLPLN